MAKYSIQRPAQGGLGRFLATVQPSNDTPKNLGVATPGTSHEVSRADHDHGFDMSNVDGFGGVVGWCINSNIVAPQSNPTAATYIHAHRIWTPHGINLKAYGIPMTTAGLKTHGNLYLSVWDEDDDDPSEPHPGTEYESARVLCFAPRLVADWNRIPLQARGVDDVACAAGFLWVIKTIEVYHGRTELPIDWWDGISAGKGHAMAILLSGQGAFPAGTWDYDNSIRQSTTPAVYLLST